MYVYQSVLVICITLSIFLYLSGPGIESHIGLLAWSLLPPLPMSLPLSGPSSHWGSGSNFAHLKVYITFLKTAWRPAGGQPGNAGSEEGKVHGGDYIVSCNSVISTSDCSDHQNIFGWLTEVFHENENRGVLEIQKRKKEMDKNMGKGVPYHFLEIVDAQHEADAFQNHTWPSQKLPYLSSFLSLIFNVGRSHILHAFLKSVTALAKEAKCKLTIPSKEQSNDDRFWLRDIQAPHKTLPEVFDSPRNSDTGEVTTFHSFGNLEVSPPVTVGRKKYPLGRILIGSGGYPSKESQEMHQAVQDFLSAQQVQAPVKLYSDWLFVGHVDEFLSFVPAPKKGFQLLLASPRACYALLEEQLKGGPRGGLKDILSDKKLRDQNSYVEKCIDWNWEVLKWELGLSERHIVDIPQLFKLQEENSGILKAEAYFPNMVNMLVLGKHLGIPKPFGPIINGQCCLEEKVRSLLEPLGLPCTFIDDFYAYHGRHGEVHWGTNVRRQPFSFKWWNMVP
ncbi:unnamed protein product [Nyctereutes procyonoides]|uniref:(raccoon dog) hypothetical protein n=1 Tax=Nyctereutes procyonoides TaxID=34880 RepID=A0A811ZSM2_NYCPR|nr:unnamed protein product [Nyctereutes procyonoides]